MPRQARHDKPTHRLWIAAESTDLAVEPRYPFPRREPTLAEAQEALAIAGTVREFVLAKLPDVL
jgi:hypothetical protein